MTDHGGIAQIANQRKRKNLICYSLNTFSPFRDHFVFQGTAFLHCVISSPPPCIITFPTPLLLPHLSPSRKLKSSYSTSSLLLQFISSQIQSPLCLCPSPFPSFSSLYIFGKSYVIYPLHVSKPIQNALVHSFEHTPFPSPSFSSIQISNSVINIHS